MSLYRVCQFARESNVLDVIFPDLSPDEYFDDRLGDTLDAIYKYGIGNLELLITRHIIEVFKIQTEICHNDTTCVQVYGEHNKNRSEQSIKFSYGYSKQYRKDLKQMIWSMTASSDSSFPLFQQAYSGNTADVETYVEQWHHLIDLLGKKDFLFAGDSKVATHGNMAHIDDIYRIEAYLFLFKTALQILVLMERTSRTKIAERDKGLDNFMPNKKDVRNPGTAYMLAMFEFVVCGIITLSDGSKQSFVSKLTETQRDILSVLDVPVECYTYQNLFDTS